MLISVLLFQPNSLHLHTCEINYPLNIPLERFAIEQQVGKQEENRIIDQISNSKLYWFRMQQYGYIWFVLKLKNSITIFPDDILLMVKKISDFFQALVLERLVISEDDSTF